MKSASYDYLDPVALSQLQHLEIIARCAVEGYFSGRHRGPFHGFSVEPRDHRSYQPGDATRSIDWKLFARTDRLYVKQFQQETSLTAHILLDVSKSMAFASPDYVSKIDYARYLAAALTFLMIGQRDRVALLTFAERIIDRLPPSSARSQFHTITNALTAVRPAGRTALGDVVHTFAETNSRRSLVVIISDLLSDADTFASALAHLRFLGHDVIVFQILDPQERRLDYRGTVEFTDLETAAAVRVDAPAIAAAYRKQIDQFIAAIKNTTGSSGADYCLLNTADSLNTALAQYISTRAGP